MYTYNVSESSFVRFGGSLQKTDYFSTGQQAAKRTNSRNTLAVSDGSATD